MIKIGKALIFAVLFAVLVFVSVGCASAASIYVPDNYTKIQWAVDNASAGDIIIVRDGTYAENVFVNKQLTIESENGSAQTIIDGGGSGDVVNITVNNVIIKGFTITGSGGYPSYAGLKINSSENTVSNNNINNNWDDGIRLYSSSNNIITSNNISNNYFGIRLVDIQNS